MLSIYGCFCCCIVHKLEIIAVAAPAAAAPAAAAVAAAVAAAAEQCRLVKKLSKHF